jgi:hypothetical protein
MFTRASGVQVRFTVSAVAAVALGGCLALEKREDAVEARAAATVSRLARSMEPQSSVTRSSGIGTRTRLKHLFPTSTVVSNVTGGQVEYLAPEDFAFEGAEKLNRAFGQAARPYESLAQMALRDKVSALCRDALSRPNVRLFQLEKRAEVGQAPKGGQLLDSETAPEDPAERAALAAVRNAWLHPYTLADGEVQEIVRLYRKVKDSSSAEGGEAGAKRAVCMAVLLAPQFWMGAPAATDSARRVSVELFRRIPTMQELDDFWDGKFTIEQYFNDLLQGGVHPDTDSSGVPTRERFVGWIRQISEEWLGFREFMDENQRFGDRRGGLFEGAVGASSRMNNPFAQDGTRQAIVAGAVAGTKASGCKDSGQQPFDPDTKMIAWEHMNYDAAAFDFVGGFLRTGHTGTVTTLPNASPGAGLMGLDEAIAALQAAGMISTWPADAGVRRAMLGDVCNGTGAGFDIDDQAGVRWRRCHGLLAMPPTAMARAERTMERLLEKAREYHVYQLMKWTGSDFSGADVTPFCNADAKNCAMFLAMANSYCVSKPGDCAGGAEAVKERMLTGDLMQVIKACGTNGNKAACTTNNQNSTRNSRNAFINDLARIAFKIRRYDASGVVAAPLQTALTALGYPSISAANLDAFMADVANFDARVDGFTTFASGSGPYYEADLADQRNPAGAGGGRLFYAQTSVLDRFSTTLGGDGFNLRVPIVNLTGTPGFVAADRRVRRLGGSSGQWQDGWSTVRLWYTGGSVEVCNNAERLWAACFHRPRLAAVGGGDIVGFRPHQAVYWMGLGTWTPDSAMTPAVATSFYCSLPNPSALEAKNGANPNQLWENARGGPLNDVASSIQLNLGNLPAGTALGNEAQVFSQLYAEMREEPYKMLRKLVLGTNESIELKSGDFRDLIKADYSYGSSCLKFFYDTQGYYLPYHPGMAGAACSGPGGPMDVKFQKSSTYDIPIGHLQAVSGAFQGSSDARSRMWNKLYGGAPNALPRRAMSGILTMPAFIAPVATKARGIAARYFLRLLCDQPTFYDPERDPTGATVPPPPEGEPYLNPDYAGMSKVDLHRSFVSQRRHLLPACFQCHRNLDPLSAALSWTFQGLLRPNPSNPDEKLNDQGGEGSTLDYLGELDHVEMRRLPMIGVRHGGAVPSAGAFMGTPVAGIEGLGKAVADSRKFAHCTVETTFIHVFGRTPAFADVKYMKEFVDYFEKPESEGGGNHEYLKLLRYMINHEIYRRPN